MDVREGRVILVENLSPRFVNLVNLVPIPNPITIALCSILHLGLPSDLHFLLTWKR